MSTTRRRFLQSTAAVSVLAATARLSAAPQPPKSANDRIQLGVIGIGPRSTYDLQAMLKFDDVRCVAICDVQESRREAGKKLVDAHYGNADCQLSGDLRELLARDDIDAVLIATGDRWHAAASILAAQAGKDIYSEKPCGITIGDCQRLADTITQQQRVFQAGTQRRSVANFQQAVVLAQSGKLGPLKRLHASIYLPVLENNWLPAQPTPDPKVCDWNLWLGPAAWRPYNKSYVDGGWRGQWDFDSGARVLDWGAHTVDLCQWANAADESMPLKYIPQEDRILCQYANGVELSIDFLSDPFGNRDPQYITRLGTCPVRFVGEEGWVETGDSGEIVASSPALQKEVENIKRVRGLDVEEHARDFFDCMRSRKQTAANQHVMRKSHIACHAAALAWVLKRELQIDPETETFLDAPDANMMRYRPERAWT